jgi:formate dehydrogenase subunit delta
MDTAKLVKMANEIATFFEAEPDPAAALEGVTAHLSRFWEPRMRRELLAWVDETGGGELRPLVMEAVKRNRDRLTPRAAATPVKTTR